jgi:hypothetical protein
MVSGAFLPHPALFVTVHRGDAEDAEKTVTYIKLSVKFQATAPPRTLKAVLDLTDSNSLFLRPLCVSAVNGYHYSMRSSPRTGG